MAGKEYRVSKTVFRCHVKLHIDVEITVKEGVVAANGGGGGGTLEKTGISVNSDEF